MFRKLMVFLAASCLSLFLFLTVTTATVVLTFTPAHIKSWLNGSQIYSTIVDDFLAKSKTLNKSDGGNNPMDDPGIQAVAKQTLSPNFLRSSVEQLIDGTTPWLDGKSPKPTFSLDFSKIKIQFADNIGAYAFTRYNQLPACQPGQAPSSTDILTVTCKAPGVDPGPDIKKAVDDLKNSNEFLANTKVTADTLTVVPGPDQGGSEQPLYQKLKDVPKIYRLARISPFVLGGLSLISILVIVFVSTDRRRGIRRVATTFYFISIILFIEVLLADHFFTDAENFFVKPSVNVPGIAQTQKTIFRLIFDDLNRVLLYFAIGFLVIAVAKTIYLIATRPKTLPQSKEKPVEAGDEPAVTVAEPSKSKIKSADKDEPKVPLDADADKK